MRRVVATARAVGVRVFVAQAIDEAAKRFYEQRGFDATATDPMLLIVLVDTLRVSLAEPDVRRFLERDVWPHVPLSERGRRLTRDEEDGVFGYGPDGV